MTGSPGFESQKSEITFFMEKTFQISFTYFAGLVAFFALSKTSFMKAVVVASGIRLGLLVALVVLLLNLVYVTLACACLFAILKRGLFVLKHAPDSGQSSAVSYVEWERFVRDDSLMPIRHRLRPLAWNIDNYYMLPLFAMIIASSAVAAFYDLAGGLLEAQITASALVILYAIPGYMLYCMSILNRECRRLLEPVSPTLRSGHAIPAARPESAPADAEPTIGNVGSQLDLNES